MWQRRLFLKLLNFEQKERRMDVAEEMLTTFNDDSGVHKMIISGNELWVFGYDIETEAQTSQWKRSEESKPRKAC